MYSIISSLATPIIIINAARNYFAWDGVTADKADQVYKLQKILNVGVAGSILLTGIGAVYAHATKFQKPNPLIMSAMAYRIISIILISFTAGYSGAAVNHWCYKQAKTR